jgi:hypothetical protein
MSVFVLIVQTDGNKMPESAQAAISSYRQAFEKGDVLSIARFSSGPAGQTLRSLAPALAEAQIASEAFSKALAEKPALNYSNPFTTELNPFSGYQLELLELTRHENEHQALVRFGKSPRLQEETLLIKKEGDGYRVSLPGFFLKSLVTYTPEKVSKQTRELTSLANVLKKMADQVTKGELATKEAVILKLAELVRASKESDQK